MAQIFFLIVLVCSGVLTSAAPASKKMSKRSGDEGQADGPSEVDAGLFEGDIEGMTTDDIEIDDESGGLANAVRSQKKLWSGGVVPYQLSDEFDEDQVSMIKKAMKKYQEKTCIKFKARSTEKYFIDIVKGDGCSSFVGRIEKPDVGQKVVYADGCFKKIGTVLHELMHALGFYHEQSRADRDNWIEVVYDNIQPKQEGNFKEYTLAEIDHLGAAYDYGSVMHYGPNYFSIHSDNPVYNTIRAKRAVGTKKMGQRNGFSKIDLYKINKLYQCKGKRSFLNTAVNDDPATCADLPDSSAQFPCRLMKKLNFCQVMKDVAKSSCPKTCKLC